jgi:uncharacterized protein YigE (DUF2233 family)
LAHPDTEHSHRAARRRCLAACRALWLLCLVLLLAACSQAFPPARNAGESPQDGPAIDPALLPTTQASPLTELTEGQNQDASLPDTPDTGWMALGQGIEGRRMLVQRPERLAPVHIVRLDPAAVSFRVGYAPGAPRLLAAWCSEKGVIAAINGGFFNPDYHSTALVIARGIASGTSYQNQGGMFAVDLAGTVSLRHLAEQPYTPDEPLLEAVQGWPMLINHGQLTYTASTAGERARRSVIAIDQAGRVLLLACPGNDFTLRGLADWLVSSDLALDAAMNLDGGSSTGLCMHTADYQERIPAFVPLPTVVQVVARP